VTWRISVAGTVDSDQVTTPHGTSDVMQGGSAVYFSLAAAHYAPVWLNGIVGRDRIQIARDLLADSPIFLDGLIVSDFPTSRWIATHHVDGSTTDHFSDEGANAHWGGEIPLVTQAAETLFLASMRPDLQQRVLEQCTSRLIGLDTMTMFTCQDAKPLRSLIQSVDLLFVNREELASITGGRADGWIEGAQSLVGEGRLRAVVVKAGPHGAALVTATAVVERPAHPVRKVIDPTGAGDALAGGFLGACARAERDDEGFLVTALEAGIRSAAIAISAFGISGFYVAPASEGDSPGGPQRTASTRGRE
jgi:sugar/nucleoside kinase (ribokinase family)